MGTTELALVGSGVWIWAFAGMTIAGPAVLSFDKLRVSDWDLDEWPGLG